MAALNSLLLLAAIVAFFYFAVIRPQRKRQMEMQKLQNSLKPGDEIITLSGMYGTVTEVEDGGTVLIEISEETEIRIAAASIGQVVTSQSVPDALTIEPAKAE